MHSIISVDEFAEYRNISKRLDRGKIEEAISLAQQSDLNRILGNFYFDVVKNQDQQAYEDLMMGSEFTYCDDEFTHQGIKSLLADYTYARFVYMINVNLTPFGAHKKLSNDSEPIDRNIIKDLAKQAQVDAGIKFETIEKYILSDTTTFSRYCSGTKSGSGFFGTKFSKI